MLADTSTSTASRALTAGSRRKNGCIAASASSASRRICKRSRMFRLNRWKGEFTRWSASTCRHSTNEGTN